MIESCHGGLAKAKGKKKKAFHVAAGKRFPAQYHFAQTIKACAWLTQHSGASAEHTQNRARNGRKEARGKGVFLPSFGNAQNLWAGSA